MVLTTEQLKNYSWMSQASYLDFQGTRSIQDKLTNSPFGADKQFSSTQAIEFLGSDTPANPTDGYSFISHEPNDSRNRGQPLFFS